MKSRFTRTCKLGGVALFVFALARCPSVSDLVASLESPTAAFSPDRASVREGTLTSGTLSPGTVTSGTVTSGKGTSVSERVGSAEPGRAATASVINDPQWFARPRTVPPTGWRKTTKGWERVASWQGYGPPLNALIAAQRNAEPVWVQTALARIASVSPLAAALFQLLSTVGIFAATRIESFTRLLAPRHYWRQNDRRLHPRYGS